MFRTIKEGVERFKEELRKFEEWRKIPAPHYEQENISSAEHRARKVKGWRSELDGMQKALGLSDEEVNAIKKEIKEEA